MKNKDFTDYNIADIQDEDVKNIADLEKSLSAKTQKDVVLIAYQHSDKVKS